MLANFSEKAQKIIAMAESLAFDLGHASVGGEHLLLAFLKSKDTKLKLLLEKQKITYEIIREEIINLFGKKESLPFYMEYTPAFKEILEDAIIESKKINEEKVSVEVLSLSFVTQRESLAIELLNKYNCDFYFLKENLKVAKVSPLDNIEELVNLNKKVMKDPVKLIDKEDDLQLIVNTLLRKQKPNALIVGDPGVGKSALVEYLAQRIVDQNIDDSLKEKVIYELDISSIVAGTKYRGEFEEKFKKIIRKIKEDPNAIIFIDEIHNIIGAGGAEGAIDASNILKPYLARGDIKCIGATTYDEYIKLIEKEKAVDRRFQLIKIDEPSVYKTTRILKGIKENYEKFHDIIISDLICEKIVEYAKKYVFDKKFPDKAIDVLDCSCVLAKKWGKKELDLDSVIKTIERNHKVEINKNGNVENIVEKIKDNIVGQDEVIMEISRHFNYIEKGLVDDNKPLGVYMFVGPSGCGKTQTAKEIARHYFGSYDSFIKIDMSEYSESISVSKLIGSAPGYVGHDSQTYIVDSIRKNPHSVIILDEIEKAHKDVLNIFLNIFDEGYFIDSKKRKVDFTNSLIIMTSNLGYSEENFTQKKVGFIDQDNNNIEVLKTIRAHFKSEFLNRVDHIFYFKRLSDDVIKKISLKYLEDYERKIGFEVSKELILEEIINDKQEVLRYGARELKRKIKKKIIDELEAKRAINCTQI